MMSLANTFNIEKLRVNLAVGLEQAQTVGPTSWIPGLTWKEKRK